MAFVHSPSGSDDGIATAAIDNLARLYAAAASAFEVDPSRLTDESSPDTISTWDSLNHLTMAMAVEGEFNLAFSAEQVMEMRNIGCVRAALRTHGVEI